MPDDPNADTIDLVDAIADEVTVRLERRLRVIESNLDVLIGSVQALNERLAHLEHSKFESLTPVPVNFQKD